MSSMSHSDLLNLIDSGQVSTDEGNIISNGKLISNESDQAVDCELHKGLDIVKARLCDITWGTFNVALMQFIDQQKYTTEEHNKVLNQIQIDDGHWSWFKKSILLRSDEYVWFFLMAEKYPQGVCLIYHPKPSAFDLGDIFYIEFLAVAPWNRKNPMRPKKFKGVGTMLIHSAITYAIDVLKLKPGFSLHSLPKAVGYYADLGMKPFPSKDKDGLPYFEMPKEVTEKMIGRAQ